jgi:hypothetical protein
VVKYEYMRKRLQSKCGIAGIAALLISGASFIAQYKLEGWTMQLENLGSPLGILFILLGGGGVFLIIWNFFRRESSFADKEAIVKQRQENLPLLRNSIDAIIERQRELAFKLGKRPLQTFFDEYLKISKEYKMYRKLLKTYHTSDEVTKHKVAILIAISRFFFVKTICLNNVCRDGEDMAKLMAEKDIYYHRNNDKALSSTIDQLLFAVTKYHSLLALGELATNNQLAYTSAKKFARFEEKPEILKGFMTRDYKKMNDRINFLMRGEDL